MESADLLAEVPFLRGLTRPDLQELATSLRRRRFNRDEVVFHRDDPGSSLFIVESGSVKIALTSDEGKEVILALLRHGDFFGELALLDDEPRSANAVAMEASLLVALPRKDFLEFLEQHPKACLSLMASLGKEVREATRYIHDSAFLDVPGRLARVLLQLSQAGSATVNGLTQGELGAMMGVTRESINKWLGFYEHLGIVRRETGAVIVLRPDELRKRIY